MSSPRRPRRWLRLVVELLVVILIFWGVGLWRGRAHPRGPLPELTLPALGGAPTSLRELAGRPALVAFFAPWCGVCKLTSQNLRWARGVVGEGTRFVSIASAYGEDAASVAAYVDEHAPPGTVLLDERGAAASAFGVTAYPTFFFVDATGHVTGSTVGYTSTIGLLARLWL